MNRLDSRRRARHHLIGYWVATAITCAIMSASGVADLIRADEVLETLRHLGYPDYLAIMLGIAKLLGVAALIAPGFPRLKEWAYAGLTFDLTGATISHIAVGDPITTFGMPAVILVPLVASYFLRPADRRLSRSLP